MTKLIERGPQWKDTGTQKETIDGEPARVTKLEVDDATTYIDKDGSDNMTLTDAVTGTKTLAELSGAGDVTAASNITDHTIVRGDGGAKGVQDSGVTIDDNDNIFTGGGNLDMGGGDWGNLGHGRLDEISAPITQSDHFNIWAQDDNLFHYTDGDGGTGTLLKSDTKLDDLATPDDNTDLDFSTSVHGLVPKGTNVGDFLKDDGTWAAPAGGGDVTGPGSSTDNAIARYHETSGKVIQDYTSNPPTISDSGDMNIDGDLDVENIVVSGNVDGIDVSALDSAVVKIADLENPPTEDESGKAATSEWSFDHDAATTGVHGAGGDTIATDANISTHAAIKSANATLGHVIVESASLIDVDGDGKLTLGAHETTHQVGGSDILYVPRTYVWFVKGTVATGTEQGATFRIKRATTIEDIELHVKTAPTGAALIVDINDGGTTVFDEGDSGTRPEIDISGTTEDDNHAFSDTALAATTELTMDIDQVGSTVAGADLTVLLHCLEAVA